MKFFPLLLERFSVDTKLTREEMGTLLNLKIGRSWNKPFCFFEAVQRLFHDFEPRSPSRSRELADVAKEADLKKGTMSGKWLRFLLWLNAYPDGIGQRIPDSEGKFRVRGLLSGGRYQGCAVILSGRITRSTQGCKIACTLRPSIVGCALYYPMMLAAVAVFVAMMIESFFLGAAGVILILSYPVLDFWLKAKRLKKDFLQCVNSPYNRIYD